MDSNPEPSDSRILESFLACRSELHHEYGVLSNRLNSYITSQAFLVSGYAISMGNMTLSGHAFRLWFPLLLSVVAILLSLRAQPGIVAACDVISRWHGRQSELFNLNRGLEDYQVIDHKEIKKTHDRNLLFAQTSPWIFGVAWLLMALLAIQLN